jgi:hypothetical protein
MPLPLAAAAAGRSAAAEATRSSAANVMHKKSALVLKNEPSAPSENKGSKKLSLEKFESDYDNSFGSTYEQAMASGTPHFQSLIHARKAADKQANHSLTRCENKNDKAICSEKLAAIRESAVYQTSLKANKGLIFETAKETARATTLPKLFGSLVHPVDVLKRQAFAGMTLSEAKALLKELNSQKSLSPEQKSQRKALRVVVADEMNKKTDKVNAITMSVADGAGSLLAGLIGGAPSESQNKTSKDYLPQSSERLTDRKKERSDDDNGLMTKTVNGEASGHSRLGQDPAKLPPSQRS